MATKMMAELEKCKRDEERSEEGGWGIAVKLSPLYSFWARRGNGGIFESESKERGLLPQQQRLDSLWLAFEGRSSHGASVRGGTVI